MKALYGLIYKYVILQKLCFWKKIFLTFSYFTAIYMTYEGSESAREQFGEFIYQLQPKIKALVRKLERILIKLYRQHMPLSFNKIV